MTIAATNDASAGALFQSAVQASGVDVSRLGAIAQLQLAVANVLGGGADLTSPLTLGANGAAFTVTGTTVASAADVASGAITFNANIGRGTGAVGGFAFAVPVTTSTGTTAQTLTNALVIKATTTTQVLLCGADALPSGYLAQVSAAGNMISVGANTNGGIITVVKINGTLAAPTIITTGQNLGSFTFAGAMTATTRVGGAQIRAVATENWVASTASGTQLVFSVTPNTTTGFAAALTLDQDTSATFALSVKTGTPNGGTAGAWKFGIRVAATVSLDTTQYIQLDVGGTLYKVGIVS